MTRDRLAAALHGWLLHDGPCPTPDKCADLMTADMTDAAAVLRADPTLICPDPADHELADAVRRLTDAVAWVMEGGPDGEPSSVWNSHGYEAKGPTLEAAITAALEDKP